MGLASVTTISEFTTRIPVRGGNDPRKSNAPPVEERFRMTTVTFGACDAKAAVALKTIAAPSCSTQLINETRTGAVELAAISVMGTDNVALGARVTLE